MSKEKCQKEYGDFCQEVDSLSAEQLKARVVQLQQALAESEACKDADEELQSAKTNVSELGAPYREVKSAVRLKTSYLIELLKEKS